MDALLWSDYLCPWCYLGRDRTRLMEELGLKVVHLPFELHPGIPPEGRTIRPDGRLKATFDRVERECDELGVPFRRPTLMPNTHRALEVAELTRIHFPGAFPDLDHALFEAMWVSGRDLGDPDVVDELAARSGVATHELHAMLADGAGSRAVDASMKRAREHGVASAPSWVVGELTIPGAQPRATFERWIRRLLESAGSTPCTGMGGS